MPAAKRDLKLRILGDSKQAEAAFRKAKSAAADTMSAMAKATAAAATAVGGLSAQVIATGNEFARIRSKLEIGGGSMNFVRKTAEELGLQLVDTADAYASLAAAAKGTALQGEASEKIFHAVATAATAMGLSGEQARGALTAIEQMISKGKVSAEELRGQLGERLPGAFQLAAQAMGMTTAELDKALASGNVMAEDLLPKLADAMEHRFGDAAARMAQGTQASLNRLRTDWQLFSKAVSDAGAYQALGNAFGALHEIFAADDEAVKSLARTVSDALITALEAGATGAGLFAKGLAEAKVVADGVRLAIDSVKLGGVEVFATLLAGLEKFYGALSHLPGSLGAPYAQAEKDITAFRAEIEQVRQGILATGHENLGKLLDDSVATEQAWAKIDEKVVKVIAALERGRGVSPPKPEASHPTLERAQAPAPAGESPAVARAREEAQKIIDIHSAKFQQIRILGQAAFADEEERLLAEQEAKFALLEEERQRMLEAVAVQIEDEAARRQALADVNAYYDQLEVDAAQQTANKLAAIEQARLKVEKQAYDARLGLASSAMGALSQVLSTGGKRAFEASKALAIAETVISTYAAAQKAYESQMAIPTPDAPVRAAIAAAIAVAQGIARVRAIANTSYNQRGAAGGAATPGGIATQGGYGGAIGTQPPPSPQPQPQPLHLNITFKSDTGFIDPDSAKRFLDTLMPMIEEAYGRGRQLQVAA